MANAIGSSDDFMSAGNSAVWNEYGEKLLQLGDTTEAIIVYDTETQ